MQSTLHLNHARHIVREAEACLQRLQKVLNALEAEPEPTWPEAWDAQDEIALMRLADDGNPHGD